MVQVYPGLTVRFSDVLGCGEVRGGDGLLQTASGVNSKVLDDYCWIHSTFHIRNEFQVSSGRKNFKLDKQ